MNNPSHIGAQAKNPDLDSTFGQDGLYHPVTNQFGDVRGVGLNVDESINLAIRLSDGKFQFDRATADGRQIPGFTPTIAPFGPDGSFTPYRLLRQSDGKILMLGAFRRYSDDASLAGVTRFNSNGTPDLVFGRKLLSPIPQGTTTPRFEKKLVDGCVQADGKILIACAYQTGSPNSSDFISQLIRLNIDGSDDLLFGTSGRIDLNFGGARTFASDVQIQESGKIVVLGSTGTNAFGTLVIARYDSRGQIDKSFGENGYFKFRHSPQHNTIPNWLGVMGEKLWIAGNVTGPIRSALLMRLTAEGNFDQTFNGGEPVLTNAPFTDPQWNSAIIQKDGGIITVGSVENPASIIIRRFNEDGTPNTERQWLPLPGGTADAVMQTSTRLIVAVRSSLVPEPSDNPLVLGVLTTPATS